MDAMTTTYMWAPMVVGAGGATGLSYAGGLLGCLIINQTRLFT